MPLAAKHGHRCPVNTAVRRQWRTAVAYGDVEIRLCTPVDPGGFVSTVGLAAIP
jgi:hypothetical protein